jgi:hypothetical protein
LSLPVRRLGNVTREAVGMTGDALQKLKSKRHGTAVKKGIKQAKERKVKVKQATLALRKAPKRDIVKKLFKTTPSS